MGVGEADRRATELTAVLAWGRFDQHHIEADAAFDPKYGAAHARAGLNMRSAPRWATSPK